MSDPAMPRVLVDHTHCGRHVTGLERITLELFSKEALAPLDVEIVRASNWRNMILQQTLGLPLHLLRERSAPILCPGFPPSTLLTWIGGDRVVPYIHDLFLMTRPQDLNARAKLYMVAPFRRIVRRAKLFLVNSQTTAHELRLFCRPDAEVVLYRPRVRNVFGLEQGGREERPSSERTMRLIAVGTVEPRKNLAAAAGVLTALRQGSRPDATLDIVGRPGWGVDIAQLAAIPGVTVHGYQTRERARTLIEAADALISTAHDEGLGLPLLEAQYAGLPVVAPDQPVFREVLGESGLLLDPSDAAAAAARIGTALAQPGWRMAHARSAQANLARWNAAAAEDHAAVIDCLRGLAARFQTADLPTERGGGRASMEMIDGN